MSRELVGCSKRLGCLKKKMKSVGLYEGYINSGFKLGFEDAIVGPIFCSNSTEALPAGNILGWCSSPLCCAAPFLLSFDSAAHRSRRRRNLRRQVGVRSATQINLLRSSISNKEAVGILFRRNFAAGGGKAKKGSKGGGAGDAPKASSLSKEVKATTVVGANILKEGADPKILPDSEYPDWLWHLLDKRPALSELRRKNIETLPYEDLKRFVKLDNRARIKENNSVKAKN
ncbi:uncharacterized protein LOC116215669 isoform X2 [Punica granatum]|uniref:Large ribosomal subunit protein mL54 n=1 Tax=Punica granatum TaxID=22663 RepID=A0A6P8EBE2_PUNGR|nr:uncharacterized protein LOC116215669 isoform X2 [Punica granatum]